MNPIERPFDPDDLPLEAERSGDDGEQGQQLGAHRYDVVAASAPLPQGHDAAARLHGRPFRLRLPGRTQSGR